MLRSPTDVPLALFYGSTMIVDNIRVEAAGRDSLGFTGVTVKVIMESQGL